MTPDGWAIVCATLAGPVVAVQVQVWLERGRERARRRRQIFYTLMQTRANNMSPEHLQALNAIPIEYYGVKVITDAYLEYIKHVYAPQDIHWANRRVDLLMDLLAKIAAHLKYKFDVAQLKRDFYAPKGSYDLEADQQTIREGMVKALTGQGSVSVTLANTPEGAEMQKLIKTWLEMQIAKERERTEAPQRGLPVPPV